MRKVLMMSAAMAITVAAHGALADGKSVYDASCAACHTPGVAGAPKTGDKAAWKDAIAKGNETLYTNSIKGFQGKAGFMPPKGGFANLSDADVKAAVDYMVGQSK
jgi:cytochrome c5